MTSLDVLLFGHRLFAILIGGYVELCITIWSIDSSEFSSCQPTQKKKHNRVCLEKLLNCAFNLQCNILYAKTAQILNLDQKKINTFKASKLLVINTVNILSSWTLAWAFWEAHTPDLSLGQANKLSRKQSTIQHDKKLSTQPATKTGG